MSEDVGTLRRVKIWNTTGARTFKKLPAKDWESFESAWFKSVDNSWDLFCQDILRKLLSSANVRWIVKSLYFVIFRELFHPPAFNISLRNQKWWLALFFSVLIFIVVLYMHCSSAVSLAAEKCYTAVWWLTFVVSQDLWNYTFAIRKRFRRLYFEGYKTLHLNIRH